MDLLTKLAQVYETDKWGVHAYTPYYHELFNSKRNWVYNLLEIGVLNGASLRMWRDFFPNAQILGIDIEHKDIEFTCFQADQRDADQLRNIAAWWGPW